MIGRAALSSRVIRWYGPAKLSEQSDASSGAERYRLQQKAEIQRRCSECDVVQVKFDLIMDGGMPITTQLPQPSQTGTHRESLTLQRRVSLGYERHFGARTNKRHLAAKYVQQLRNLIKSSRAQESPDTRDLRICLCR